MAEDGQVQFAPNPPAAAPPSAPTDVPSSPPADPGPLGAVGRFIGDSVSGIGAGIKATGKAIGEVTAPARGAATAVVRLPNTRFVSGNERCAVAPNGAPDCAAAAEALCRAKGFAGGRSLDTQTRYCIPQAAAVGGPLKPADCIYVTRALCQ
jgi:hypothetical protein